LRIQRAVLRELATMFVGALVVVTGVLFTASTLQQMSRLQGLELRYLLGLVPTLLPVAAAYAAPFAFLVAVAFTFGRMAADRELVALRIAGLHPRLVVAPVAAAGALLSLGCLASLGWWIPAAKEDFNRQAMDHVEVFTASLSGSDEGIVFKLCRMSWDDYAPSTEPGSSGTFVDFELDQRDEEGNLQRKVLGPAARLRRDGDELVLETDLAWILAEEESHAAKGSVDVGPHRVAVGQVDGLGATTAFNDLLGGRVYERKAPDVDLPDLWYMTTRGDLPKVPRWRSLIEMHGRLAVALTPFVFGLVAVSIALHLPARGRRLLGVLLAFLPVVLVHFPLSVAGKSLAEGNDVPVWAGMWGANGVMLLGAAVLLRKAYRR
jgi:lipopolysaccharide export LptBFGC system permease protein LptF